jgi:hydroxymethylglutaryl-CoA reductase
VDTTAEAANNPPAPTVCSRAMSEPHDHNASPCPPTSPDPTAERTSRLPGFRDLTPTERLDKLAQASGLSRRELDAALGPGALDHVTADRLIENVVGLFELPFALGLNLRVEGVDRIVPMVVEEPSIVAAFSRVARLVRAAGGFAASAEPSLTAAQIHLTDMGDPEAAAASVLAARDALLEGANASVPRLVARGGGARRLTVRRLTHEPSGQTFLSVHVHVDVVDAMGANLANTVAERLAPRLAELTGGRTVMGILSNLADERLARAHCEVPWDVLAFGGLDGSRAARRVEEGWRIADADPYRAVTHNKGVMNGIDAAATALGQDVRALEAGAHAWAARDGRIQPLSRFVCDAERRLLIGDIVLPMAVTTVGHLRRLHPTVALAHRLLGCERARDLAAVLAAVGLAQSLAAVQTLVTEGIQRGHMRLHARKDDPEHPE